MVNIHANDRNFGERGPEKPRNHIHPANRGSYVQKKQIVVAIIKQKEAI